MAGSVGRSGPVYAAPERLLTPRDGRSVAAREEEDGRQIQAKQADGIHDDDLALKQLHRLGHESHRTADRSGNEDPRFAPTQA